MTRTRTVGGVAVGAIGLGAMPLSVEGRPSHLRAACEASLAADLTLTAAELARLDGAAQPG